MPNKLEQQEYPAFRDELNTIVASRYTILGLAIAVLGIITGFIFPRTGSTEAAGMPFPIERLLPCLYIIVLLPCMYITYYMTIHYRRVDAYLWSRFESENEPSFQMAYSKFRQRERGHTAYTKPLIWTYIMLALFAIGVSFFVNYEVVVHRESFWEWPVAGMSGLLLLSIAFYRLMSENAMRRRTRSYQMLWTQTLDYVRDLPKTGPKGAVFLDRDGVINQNREDGVTSLDQFKFIDRAKLALAELTENGFMLVVVTNQPYVGNDKMTEDDLNMIHRNMREEIWKGGGYIRKIYTCTHLDDFQCSCRKPGTQLFFQASRELNIDLKKSWVIGDQMSDIEAGIKIGARTVLVRTGEGEKEQARINNYAQEMRPYRIVRDIKEAADIIIKKAQ